MSWRTLSVQSAFEQVASGLDATRERRAYGMCQKLASEVSARRGRTGSGNRPARALADPMLAGLNQPLVSAASVAALRDGDALIIDPQPAWLPAGAMREAQ